MIKLTKKGTINHIIMLISLMSSLCFTISCVEDSARKGRPIIRRFGSVDEAPTFCQDTFNISERSCVSNCPVGTRVANETEIEEAKDELQALNLDAADLEEIFNNIDAATQVCVQGSGVLRPNNQVFVDKGYCACQAGKSAIINDCAAFCSSKTNNNITLFGKVRVGEDILFNDDLGNLFNWCNAEIPNSDFTGPGCQLEVYDGDTTQFLNISIPRNSNTFTVVMDQLDKEKTYVARIRETQSGSNVQSSAFQIYLKDPESDTTPAGPLKIMPVSQYTCIFRSQDGDNFLEYARQHFYFAASNTPPSLPPGDPLITCHDVQTYGENDSPLFPRLELIPQHFAVWNQSDIRFNDGDGDGTIDINEEITEEFKERTNQQNDSSIKVDLFSPFPWPNLPSIPDFKSVNDANLGMIMIPFIDSNNRGECPNQEDYLSNNPLFNIIGDKVGIDTEGLYMAESEPFLDSQGGTLLDVILIREGDLKDVWFYFENGQHFVPDQVTSGSKTIHFYWPLDKNAPYIRKSNQIIYTVRFPDQIGKNGVTTGIVEGIRPPDKRFACIPAVD